MSIKYPDPFLEVRVTHLAPPLHAEALCSGYEGGTWRSERLADHLFQWLPYAALSQEHQLSFGSHNFVELLRLAAAHIYNTEKTLTRGELGELLLHIACVLHYSCVPVVCKLLLKTSSNDTVKGFDGIHLIPSDESFDLWLGESKFYQDPRAAVRDAVSSVKNHILPDFLNTEKAMVFGHIPSGIPHHAEIVKLFKRQTSSDELIRKSVFPILVAYESRSVSSYNHVCGEFVCALKNEVANLRVYFQEQIQNVPLRFQLIFVPMERKADVVSSFDKKLEPFL